MKCTPKELANIIWKEIPFPQLFKWKEEGMTSKESYLLPVRVIIATSNYKGKYLI